MKETCFEGCKGPLKANHFYLLDFEKFSLLKHLLFEGIGMDWPPSSNLPIRGDLRPLEDYKFPNCGNVRNATK